MSFKYSSLTSAIIYLGGLLIVIGILYGAQGTFLNFIIIGIIVLIVGLVIFAIKQSIISSKTTMTQKQAELLEKITKQKKSEITKISRDSDVLICPVCQINVDKESRICPSCNRKI